MVSILKKFLALLLALCLTAGLMAGCGSSSESAAASSAASATEAAEATEAEAPAAEEAAEELETPADIAAEDSSLTMQEVASMTEATAYAQEIFGEDAAPETVEYPIDTTESLSLVATFPDPLFASYPNAMADCYIYQAAEEKTGIHVEYQGLSTSASSEQFNVMIASGSYPDMIGWGLNYATGDDAAVEEEIYLDLTDYIADYAPNYYQLLSTDDELLKTAVSSDGYITAFFGLTIEDGLSKAGLVIRTDLLEKNGMDKPYTIDEWEETLAMFQNEGLEQPLMMLSPGAIQDDWIAAAFDVAAFCNNFPQSTAPVYVEDGTIKFGPIEDGFYDYISLMHDWYEKGYIHSDFISINSNWNGPDYSNAITTGEAGIFYSDVGNIGGYVEASEVEGFALEATYDMHADADSVNHFAQFSSKSAGNGFHITTNCDESKIELACRWGDWWYTEEGSLIANYGEEGNSFEYVDGVPTLTEVVTKSDLGMRDALLVYASNGTICCVIDPDAVTSGYSELDKAAPEIWAEGMDNANVIPSTVAMTADEQTEANAIYSDIETTCMEYIAKFITGDKSLDEYDEMVETIKSMNIDGYLEIRQAAYDRAMEA